MIINRTLKFRLFPSKSQTKLLNRYVGSNRFVYNLYLHFNIKKKEQNKNILSVAEMKQTLPSLKQFYSFLNDIPDEILFSTIINLKTEINNAIKNKDELPSFLKKDRQEYFIVSNDFLLMPETSRIHIKGIGNLKFKNTYNDSIDVHKITVVKKYNKWFVYLLTQKNLNKSLNGGLRVIGIDVGLKEFAFFSNGKKVDNPRFYRTLEEKLVKEQKILTKKKIGSENWKKQLLKVQKIHECIYNSRMDFLHKLSSFLIEHYDVIGIEKLYIRSMVKNEKFSKSILDASWGAFIKMLKYKALEQNKKVIEVGRFYPSSQLCSNCGNKQFMPVQLRTYSCKNCGFEIDRDYNAAKNIEHKAKELLNLT